MKHISMYLAEFSIICGVLGLLYLLWNAIKPSSNQTTTAKTDKSPVVNAIDDCVAEKNNGTVNPPPIISPLDNQTKSITDVNPVAEIIKTTTIIIAQPVFKIVDVFKVEKVEIEGKDPFMSIVCCCDRERIEIKCSILEFDGIDNSNKLPLGSNLHNTFALIYVIYVPADGRQYGYINDLTKDVIPYKMTNRYHLVSIEEVLTACNNSIYYSDFKRKCGRTYNADTRTIEDTNLLLECINQRRLSIDWFKEKGVNCLYHFTDKSNLELIRSRGGLCSRAFLETKNLNIPRPGGNPDSRNLDMKHSLANYVRTSICKSHPMAHRAKDEGRIGDFEVLEIDLQAITDLNVVFSDMNATANVHTHGDSIDVLKSIDFSIFKEGVYYSKLSELNRKHYQAEVMFEKCIPLKYIKNL